MVCDRRECLNLTPAGRLVVLLLPIFLLSASRLAEAATCSAADPTSCQKCSTAVDCDLTNSPFHSARCYPKGPANSSSSASSSSGSSDNASADSSTVGTCYGIFGE